MSPLFGPDADTVLARGAPTPGTIVGIAVSLTSEDSPTRIDDYAVEASGAVYGVRQRLHPDEDVRLGMPVTLRIDGKHAVIEWGTVDTYRWKSLSTPPGRGITDLRDTDDRPKGLESARRKGERATAEILGFESRKAALGLVTVTDARCRITPATESTYDAVIPQLRAPFYASHLMAVGTVLPVWHVTGLLGDRMVIDWPAAAEATPGVGKASLTEMDVFEPDLETVTNTVLSKLGVSLPTVPQGTGATDVGDVVSWETFLKVTHDIEWQGVRKKDHDAFAQTHGVPAGEWKAASDRWFARMGSDMSLGMEYGQAMSRP